MATTPPAPADAPASISPSAVRTLQGLALLLALAVFVLFLKTGDPMIFMMGGWFAGAVVVLGNAVAAPLERPSRWALGAILVVLVGGGLFFLALVGSPLVLAVGLGISVGLVLAQWVAEDAAGRDMPAVIWTAAVVIAPPLGLVGYLIAREVRGQTPP